MDNPLEEVARLIEVREYEKAIQRLQPLAASDATGEGNALLGLAYFYREDYARATTCYKQALKLSPDHPAWQEMCRRAGENTISGISHSVPPIGYFNRDTLLASPDNRDAFLFSPPKFTRKTAWEKMIGATGRVLGRLIGKPTHFIVWLYGRLFGYQTGLWTNWYKRGRTRGILTLGFMRDQLNRNNLKSVYPKGQLIAFQGFGQIPPDAARYFRTADGSWNNFQNPKEGAAKTRFMRNTGHAVIRPERDEELLTPNPQEISTKLLTRGEKMNEVPFLNLLAAAWIQFQNHDWISHGENQPMAKTPIEIPLREDDPIRIKYGQITMRIPRTQPDPTYGTQKEETPITFINEVTHWWDGSQIYGSDQETQNRVRSFTDGKLKLTDGNRLPLGEGEVETTGFNRNWWVGLSLLHTLFTREHNAICDRLKQKYPRWDDHRLFNVARLINAAVMAKIHTIEWTPAILPNRELNLALHANWYGMATTLFRRPKSRRTKATLNIAHPEVGGVVGNAIDKHGSPYGLTEEFVEVYRLHSLLPEKLLLRRLEDGSESDVPFPQTRQAGSPKLIDQYGIANLFFSFGNQHPGALTLHNYPRFMQEISVPGNPVLTMGAVDILRARERGVPRYNTFRQALGLKPIDGFEDLTDNPNDIRVLREVYGNDKAAVNRLDLLIGTLAEATKNRPTGFGFGETLFQIFILNATRRLQADRFYTDDYREEIYTKEGMDWIDDTDLKTVLLRHYPELAGTGLANIRNAFEPWDETDDLNPERHPLLRYG